MSDSYDFVVKRDDFHETGFLDASSDLEISLLPEQALLKILSYSMTANNITYAAMGDAIGYWKFFPSSDGWGRIPAWGFAEVVRSGVAGLEPGDRIYGYLPMSEYLVVQPDQISEAGFIDMTPHRQELPAAYNRYSRASKASDKLAREPQVAIFAPLFATSFMLDDWLSDEKAFGATRLLLSSSSSKTALALAWLINQNSRLDVELVGLTSTGNVDFVKSTGYYDKVLDYGSLDEINDGTPSAYIDFSGNSGLKKEIHDLLGDSLKASIIVGATSWDKLQPDPDAGGLPGPTPVLFFAPEHIARRSEEWGPKEVWERIGAQQSEFIVSSDDWLKLKSGKGKEDLRAAYLEVLDGTPDPAVGWTLEP